MSGVHAMSGVHGKSGVHGMRYVTMGLGWRFT